VFRGCISLIAWSVLIVAGLAVGWYYRDDISRLATTVKERVEPPVELAASASPELARRAEEKIVALGQGETDEIVLSAAELDSWIEHGLQGFFPEYVSGVTTQVEDDRLVLSGRVAVEGIPGIDDLGPAAALVGDTASVSVRGRLDGLEAGRGVYYVESIYLGPLPMPNGVRDQLLSELKGDGAKGLPANAVAFDLPRFVTDIGVRADGVFLRSSRLESG
jgi:hypothetical protein